MVLVWKPCHVRTDLGQDDLSDMLVHSRDRVQLHALGLERGQAVGHLRIQRLHLLIQVADVIQLQAEHQALVVGQSPLERRHHLLLRGAESPPGQCR